ncbi:MAG: peptide-methionine (R)-S-oxide reductase MsrB [Algibacter sp.]|uniref:peptide-methionine (R)-S-oxide reductase MsrB n=1 Tax=Algibacter sp. TaxID=1872428 RepID=UPI0026390EFE|nr:peptide-methionine (R)-S-oxide reductase MsrB [Algibacter sp.]MDG1729404.1 peptide-methionine (R)-S-oxide reductase MsrB [Algibacter sp.]MDG2178616.1 peptide-methionine (R)-S-oxide reductase MsrB [Algibacter sp.]
MNKLLMGFVLTLFFNCNSTAQKKTPEATKTFEITKTEAEWKAELSAKEFHVLRQAGTERAFSSPLNKNNEAGVYLCKGCNTPLFKSEHKYDSGSGWPSFDREIEGHVAFSTDYDLGYARTEEHCATCGGHLGHIFNDGPKETTGKRHCINGVALKFIPNL